MMGTRKLTIIFMTQLLLLIFVTQTNESIFNKTLVIDHFKKQNLSEAVISILHESLPEVRESRFPLFNFVAYSSQPKRLRYFEDIIARTLSGLTSDITLRVSVNRPMYIDKLRHDAVILVDTAEALKFIYKDLNKFHMKANHYYLIILHTFGPHYYDELHEILNLCWQNGILYSNVLIHALWKSILLYTAFPYHMQHCNGIAPALQNRFENHQWQQKNKTFFPYKVGDLYGCSLVCATWEDMPYLQIYPTYFEGIEGRLLNHLEEIVNFKIEIKFMTEQQIQKSVTDEHAVFDELFEMGTDFVLGAFPYRQTSVDSPYAPSAAYFFSDLYLFINGKRYPFTPFAKLVFPFYYEVWALLLFIFLLGALVSAIVSRHQHSTRTLIIGAHNSTPTYNMLIVCLGGNITAQPRRNFARFLLFKWLLASLVLRAAYQALMFHYIRIDVAKDPPNTIAEILQQKFQIHMSQSVFNSIKNLTEIRLAAQIFNGTEIENFDKLNNSTEKIAILAPYEYYAYYKQLQKQLPHIHVIKEKIFTQQLSIYMRKNSVMLARFDAHIAQYYSYGISGQTIKQFIKKRFDEDSAQFSRDTVKVKFDEILGIFQLLIFGDALSSFVFIFEIVCAKVKGFLKLRRRRVLRIPYLN